MTSADEAWRHRPATAARAYGSDRTEPRGGFESLPTAEANLVTSTAYEKGRLFARTT